jgi:MFS family permease
MMQLEREVGPMYRWYLVGLLWFCGFFNYADRQAINAVFPLLKLEFALTDFQLGLLGSAFMVVYALAAPFAGFLVDLASRRVLIASGLAFWSLICAATGVAGSFRQLLYFRAAEGLGESFYFPASMTILADYHAPSTRSRAMSIHQTSVYVGTAGGMVLAGILAERFGWRLPFWVLGIAGMAFAAWIATQIVEPARGQSETKKDPDLGDDLLPPEPPNFARNLVEIVTNPASAALLSVFIGANFVAAVFLTWLPSFIGRKFGLGLAAASLTSTVWPLASLIGALLGGYVADRASARTGGRIRVQAFGLLVAAPFVLATTRADTIWLVVAASLGLGLCKGVYDANIFASLYDVVRPSLRGTAAGLMNTVGWTGGFVAPVAIGRLSGEYGLGRAIELSAAVYVAAGLLAVAASVLAARKPGMLPD